MIATEINILENPVLNWVIGCDVWTADRYGTLQSSNGRKALKCMKQSISD